MLPQHQGPVDDAGMVVVRLLQGYLWHPRDLELDLADWLPESMPGGVHLLWDPLDRPPFAFFDDGTPSSTQVVYQFTVLIRTWQGDEEDFSAMLPGLAEQLQEKLELTPPGVGWSLSEDLRPLG